MAIQIPGLKRIPFLCFGARDNKYGSLNVPYGGEIAAVKLIYLSGYVTCDGQVPHYSFSGVVVTILQLDITSVLPSQHQAMPSWCRQTSFSRIVGVLESGPSYPDITHFPPRLSCRVLLLTRWARAKSCDCGMVRIWWPTLNTTMEDWSAVMFMFCTSDNNAGKFQEDFPKWSVFFFAF